MNRQELFIHLKETTHALRNPLIADAFEKVDRKDFVPKEYASQAYEDYPLPLGYGQTISQPTTVAFMLELLDPKEGHRILDVGSGSGFTTALLASIVGPSGSVIGVEILPNLLAQSKNNIASYSLPNVSLVQAGKEFGLPAQEPYDRILVSAAAEHFPEKLIEQLTQGGILVIPVRESIYKITRTKEGHTKESCPGYLFVPLVPSRS